MSRVVLDASAVIAVLNQESGAEQLTPHLANACCSAVNAAEVQGKLVERGLDPDNAWEDVKAVISEILPFTDQQAKTAGTLIAQTRASGLSFGDRSCLALALSLNLPVYTADRSWKHLKLGVPIHVIR
ncbi:MAG TPA: type II toxin-antitoxin system VapC family toxin [Candidatus Sulfotelmatobacter sp.]|nr:type II toxin-antitoxin system VapC family toxin [Candidatus Sulfotelmatobacter sp.]